MGSNKKIEAQVKQEKISLKRAVEYYEKAASQGVAWAQINLGDCYRNGIGVEINLDKARYYYTMAIKQAVNDERKLEFLEKIIE